MSSAQYRPLQGSAPNGRLDDDSEPLLERNGQAKATTEEGSAGLRSSVANLENTILGTGMLAMSHAVAAGGIVPGIITILASGSMAAFGLYLLSMCAQRAPHRQSSFFALSQLTYPKAGVIFDGAIAIKCFGVSISYLIILGSLIPKVMMSFANDESDLPSLLVHRETWVIFCVAVLSPLCFLRRLHSFRFISYFSMIAVTDLLSVVTYECFFGTASEQRGRIDVFRASSALLSSLPVYIFAFTCAQNLHSVHNELRDNSQKRMNAVVGISIGSASLLYLLIGLMGYATFGNKVSANIMEMYPHSFFTNQCRLMIVFFVLFSYPLQIHPCRASLDKVIVALQSPKDNDETTTVAQDAHAPSDIPQSRFITLTVVLLCATTIVALLVSSLEAVLGIVGATGSTTISFLLPGAFYLKLYPATEFKSNADRWRRIGARVLLVLGFIVMTLALGLNVYEWIHPHKTPGRGGGKHKGSESDDLLFGVIS